MLLAPAAARPQQQQHHKRVSSSPAAFLRCAATVSSDVRASRVGIESSTVIDASVVSLVCFGFDTADSGLVLRPAVLLMQVFSLATGRQQSVPSSPSGRLRTSQSEAVVPAGRTLRDRRGLKRRSRQSAAAKSASSAQVTLHCETRLYSNVMFVLASACASQPPLYLPCCRGMYLCQACMLQQIHWLAKLGCLPETDAGHGSVTGGPPAPQQQ